MIPETITDEEFEALCDDYQEAVLYRHSQCEIHNWCLDDEFAFQDLRILYERYAQHRGIPVYGG